MAQQTARLSTAHNEGIGVLRCPGVVLFGNGVSRALGRLVAQFGERVLVCTDSALASGPHVAHVLAVLRDAGLTVSILDAAVPELPLEVVERAVGEAGPRRPDCVVGVGGGSCLDLAKLVALGLTSDEPFQSFYGERKVKHAVKPVIGVPTTAGTGSEVSPVAVVSDPGQAMKVGISSEHLIPRAAVCDPALTLGAPPAVTAYAGIDALAHAIEAFTALSRTSWGAVEDRVFVGKNLLSDPLALRAVSRIGPHLRDAIDDSLQARSAVLEGSLCAALAFGTAGTAVAHALQYPLGARTKTPHGLGTGMLLPYAMRFHRDVRAAELSEIAQALGCADHSADAAIDAVVELGRSIGLPSSLAELGLSRDELPTVAEQALTITRLVSNNPRRLDFDGALTILEAAWFGDVTRIPIEPAQHT
jgi:alcohol dehydrogenase class IV